MTGWNEDQRRRLVLASNDRVLDGIVRTARRARAATDNAEHRACFDRWLSDAEAEISRRGDDYNPFPEPVAFAAVHQSAPPAKEDDGFVVKEVLRTGTWPVIPTRAGRVSQPLRIVRDGVSDPTTGTIALAELVANFGKAVERVQIPLSDDQDDHKNTTRVNTGFVRDLWIVDDPEGSKLVAKMEFTEPDIRAKVLRGTYADVSCGIPWAVQSRGHQYGAALEHVAITNRPFIDGLGPFLAMSDGAGDRALDAVEYGDTTAVKFADFEARIARAEQAVRPAAETRESDDDRQRHEHAVQCLLAADGLADWPRVPQRFDFSFLDLLRADEATTVTTTTKEEAVTTLSDGPRRATDQNAGPSVAARTAAAKEAITAPQTIRLGPGRNRQDAVDIPGESVAARVAAARNSIYGDGDRQEARQRAAQVRAEMEGRARPRSEGGR